MGAEAIKELLKRVDIEGLSGELREKMKNETSLQKRLKYAKRLKVVEAFRKSGNKPQLDDSGRDSGHSAGAASPGSIGWRPFRHLRPE